MRPLVALSSICILAVLFSGCFGEPEDEDQLTRDVEEAGYTITIEHVGGERTQRKVTSSPFHVDLDEDGLDDMQERLERTDPRSPDTDEDGLLDGDDIVLPADDPRVETWRDHEIAHEETAEGAIIFYGERGHGGDPKDADTDDDGIADGDEVEGYAVVVNGVPRTVTTLAYVEDTDGDGIQDGVERDNGLDPTQKDTDRDGTPDHSDLDPWSDVFLRLEVRRLHLDAESPGGDPRAIVAFFQAPGHDIRSGAADVPRGETVDGAPWSSEVLDVSDDGGDFRARQHNLSFALTFLVEGQTQSRVDLASTTAGGGSTIFGQLDAVSGALRMGTRGEQPWPADGRFEGPDGWVELSVVRAEPQ